MKVWICFMLLLAYSWQQGVSYGNVLSETELLAEKDFVSCYNLARIQAMTYNLEIGKIEKELEVTQGEGLLRFMMEVLTNCIESAPEEAKNTLFELYKEGQDYPDVSFYPQDLIMSIDTFKTPEDFQIPKEQSKIYEKSNKYGTKFRETFEHFKAVRKEKEYESRQGLVLFGINIDKLSTNYKLLYVLIAFGILVLILFYFIAKLDNKEVNTKHLPKKRRDRNSRKKAKTT